MVRYILAFIILSTGWAQAAADFAGATPGTTYFNRPGADIAAHNSELKACLLRAEESFARKKFFPRHTASDYFSGTNGPYARAMYMRSVENCMVVSGWRVISVASSPFGANEGMSLSQAVGAEFPPGVIARVWNNGAANPAAVREQLTLPVNISLSLASLKMDEEFQTQRKQVRNADILAMTKGANPALTSVDSLPPERAVIIMASRGMAPVKNVGLSLRRAAADPYHAAARDGHPDSLFLPANGKGSRNRTTEDFIAFIVPAGRWYVYTHGGVITYCLGAPYFDVGPGQVVFAGLVDFSSDSLSPDMSLEPARAFLKNSPGALAKVEPAAWRNGFVRACGEGGFSGYALEYPEAPYEDGVHRLGTPGVPIPMVK